MKLLLDTHAFIWFIEGVSRLPVKTQSLIASSENEVFVSIASFWELAIKISLGKLKLSQDLPTVYQQTPNHGFDILQIESDAIFKLLTLPMHHRDPFDRVLIASALTQNMSIVSVDKHFSSYETLDVIWN